MEAEEFIMANELTGSKVSSRDIEEAELELGVILPDLYKKFILSINGGSVKEKRENGVLLQKSRIDLDFVANSWGDSSVYVSNLRGIKDAHMSLTGDSGAWVLANTWDMPAGLLPFMGTHAFGDDAWCFDYRRGFFDGVCYLDVDYDSPYEDYRRYGVYKITNTLEEFFNRLKYVEAF